MPDKNQKSVRTISVTGGKGGVGKTVTAINLALALSQQGKRVILLDADLGLANIDVALGLNVKRDLSDVLAGDCSLEEIIIDGPLDIRIVPASSGKRHMTNLSAAQNAGVINAFADIANDIDVLIVDTAAGISESVINFSRACHDIIITVCNEPTSITDAYALIKSLHEEDDIFRFHIIANMVENKYEGEKLFAKLTRVTGQFLDIKLEYLGAIPFDEYVKKAVRRRKALIDCYPGSKAAKVFKDFASKADNWPMPTMASGYIEFFVEQMVSSGLEQHGTRS